MTRRRPPTRAGAAAVWLVALAASFASHACSDVGDSSAISNGETVDDAGSVVVADAPVADEEASVVPDGSPTDEPDAGAGDTGAPRSDDGGSPTEDTGAGWPVDAETPDAIVLLDAGIDATVSDSGAPDAGVAFDAGFDAGVDAGSSIDAGPPIDAGETADAGVDSGHTTSALAPCTTAGQTNCVQCQYNNGASGTLPNADQLCTPTEAALVAHDIASGQATVAGPDPDSSCYACAALSGCLDDSEFNDQGHECEDLVGAANASACEATLACVLQSSCGFASGAISTCYCGTAPVSGTCAAAGASNAANGACKAAEAAGLGFTASDGLDILKNFTSTTLPSGVANNILQCAASNDCTSCLH